jgi:hypothetical protein
VPVSGDTVLLKKGDTWRAQIVPISGVTYGSYDTGDKPLILGSVQLNSTSDWIDEGGNVWSHSPNDMALGDELLYNPSFDTDADNWSLYCDAGAGAVASLSRTTTVGEYDSSPGGGKIDCTTNGTNYWDMQLMAFPASVVANTVYKLTFRAKASTGFNIPLIEFYDTSNNIIWCMGRPGGCWEGQGGRRRM